MQIKFSDYNEMEVESNSNNNNNKSIMVASFRVTNDPWLLEFNFCVLPFHIVIVDLFTNRLWCKSCHVCLRLGEKGHQGFLLAMSWIACLRGTGRSSAWKSTREGAQASDKSLRNNGVSIQEPCEWTTLGWIPQLLQPAKPEGLATFPLTPHGTWSQNHLATSPLNFWHQKQNIINICCFKLPSCRVIC